MHARMALVWLAANGGASSSISTGWAMIKPAWPVVDLGVGRQVGRQFPARNHTTTTNNHTHPDRRIMPRRIMPRRPSLLHSRAIRHV